MYYFPGCELIRKNCNGSSDRAEVCEVRLGRVIALLSDGGRETFCVRHGAGWICAPAFCIGAESAESSGDERVPIGLYEPENTKRGTR